MSGCTVRIPYFIVASNSLDRLMRLRAESTAETRRCDQAVSARRPLRRRLDTIERPARVRIRKRKPCTRARRRLFGWKVRLPLATAFSSLCLAQSIRAIRPRTLVDCVRLRVGRRWVLLLAGAVPRHVFLGRSRIAGFGRLYEGTDEPSLGQTWSAPTGPNIGENVHSHRRRCGTITVADNKHTPKKPKERDCNAAER